MQGYTNPRGRRKADKRTRQADALSRRAERAERHAKIMAEHDAHRAEQARVWGAFYDALRMHELESIGPHPIPPNGAPPLGFGYLVTS